MLRSADDRLCEWAALALGTVLAVCIAVGVAAHDRWWSALMILPGVSSLVFLIGFLGVIHESQGFNFHGTDLYGNEEPDEDDF